MPAAIAEPPVKPTTPAPAPSPTPTPSPTTAPKTTDAAPVLESADEDRWQGLDDMVSGKKPEPKAEPKPTEKAPDPKPGEPKTATASPQPTASAPKQLREELERAKAELKSKEDAVSKYEARIAEFESKGKDTAALAEKLSKVEKERDEALSEVRAAKAEMSPDFKEKWDKPFDRQAEIARRMISKLAVGKTVTDEATGETGWKAERQAVWEKDFPKFYQMYAEDPVGTEEKVSELFGKGGRIVMGHIESLFQLDQARESARVDEKAHWKEKETAERAQSVQREIETKKQQDEQRAAWEKALEKTRESFIEKHPDWYGEDPEDPEGNKLLDEGRKLMKEEAKTFQESVILATRNRLNAESAIRDRYRVRVLRDKVSELEATIQELKSKKPGPGTRSTTDVPAKDKADTFEGLEEVFNKQ